MRFKTGRVWIFLLLAVISGSACDRKTPQKQAPPKQASQSAPVHSSVLDGAYDENKWRWEKQPDADYFLLKHQSIQECVIATDWPMHLLDEEEKDIEMKKSTKQIGGADYEATEIYSGGEIEETHYYRDADSTCISVFGSKACQKVAAEVLLSFENLKK